MDGMGQHMLFDEIDLADVAQDRYWCMYWVGQGPSPFRSGEGRALAGHVSDDGGELSVYAVEAPAPDELMADGTLTGFQDAAYAMVDACLRHVQAAADGTYDKASLVATVSVGDGRVVLSDGVEEAWLDTMNWREAEDPMTWVALRARPHGPEVLAQDDVETDEAGAGEVVTSDDSAPAEPNRQEATVGETRPVGSTSRDDVTREVIHAMQDVLEDGFDVRGALRAGIADAQAALDVERLGTARRLARAVWESQLENISRMAATTRRVLHRSWAVVEGELVGAPDVEEVESCRGLSSDDLVEYRLLMSDAFGRQTLEQAFSEIDQMAEIEEAGYHMRGWVGEDGEVMSIVWWDSPDQERGRTLVGQIRNALVADTSLFSCLTREGNSLASPTEELRRRLVTILGDRDVASQVVDSLLEGDIESFNGPRDGFSRLLPPNIAMDLREMVRGAVRDQPALPGAVFQDEREDDGEYESRVVAFSITQDVEIEVPAGRDDAWVVDRVNDILQGRREHEATLGLIETECHSDLRRALGFEQAEHALEYEPER